MRRETNSSSNSGKKDVVFYQRASVFYDLLKCLLTEEKEVFCVFWFQIAICSSALAIQMRHLNSWYMSCRRSLKSTRSFES